MTEKKIIAVVGATGSQGGGLVRAILADPDREFAARVLTRNSQSGKARELAASGAEVVEADLDDEASLVRAFEGAHGFEGFASGLGPVRDASGKLVLTLPMADQPLSGIAVDDIGRTALGIFKRGREYIGQTVSIAGDHLTGDEYAAALTDALGELVVYQPNTWDDFRRLGFPGAVEMANMFQFYAEDSKRFTGDRNLAAVRNLNPELQSFRDWLSLHKAEIPVA